MDTSIDFKDLDLDVHLGGPVEMERGFFLHTNEYNKNLLFNPINDGLAVSSNLQIIQDMDPTNTGSVTLQNFERWIMAEEKACGAGDKLDVSAVADAIFTQMDEDGSGTISISELMQQLLQWSGSANFNYEDALDVIKDFSRDDSGELDEHDFYQLLVKITVAEMSKADYKL